MQKKEILKEIRRWVLFLFCVLIPFPCSALFLRDHLDQAKPGDYLVAARNKNYTLICIRECLNHGILIEEISIPENRFSKSIHSWKAWVEKGAPNHTGWVSYSIDLTSGKMQDYYSHTHQCWYKLNEESNILNRLLHLPFQETPLHERKRRGSSHSETSYWQPKMVVNGVTILNVHFTPYRSRWPKDGSELAGKIIEIYLPENNQLYPAYFPYWLQTQGTFGKTYLRIIDSGTGLQSPKNLMTRNEN